MILIVRIPTHRLRIPSSKMENPTNTIIIAAASNGLIKTRTPITPVTSAISRICHHNARPNHFASTDIWILNRASARIRIPNTEKIRSTAKFFLAIRITPTAISRIPKARSN